jgi:hypothetical protein
LELAAPAEIEKREPDLPGRMAGRTGPPPNKKPPTETMPCVGRQRQANQERDPLPDDMAADFFAANMLGLWLPFRFLAKMTILKTIPI